MKMKKFTPLEWEIILHRLEVPDAIVEVLTDDDLKYSALRETIIYTAINNLYVSGGFIHDPSAIHMDVLREACSGSTFFCGIDCAVASGEISKDKRKRLHTAADVLESMLNVTIPRA